MSEVPEESHSAALFWKQALDSARQGVWEYDIRVGTSYYSDTWRRIRGIGPDQPLPESDDAWLEKIHPDDRALAAEQTRKLNAGDLAEVDYEYRERHSDGHWIWIMCRGRAVAWDAEGKPCRFVGTDTDITAVKASEDRIRAMSRRLELALSSVQIGVFVYYIREERVEWDWRLRMIYGLPAEDGPLPRDIWEQHLHPEDRDHATFVSYDALRRCADYDVGYRIIRQSDGAVRHIRCRASYQNDRTHGPILVGVNWDTTEERETAEALRQANDLADRRNAELEEARGRMDYNAQHDALTGLPNRKLLDQLEAEMSAQSFGSGRAAMLHVDLDRFKQINDVHGHDVGDFVLCNTAAILRARIPRGATVARVGGDEFAVLFPDAPDPAELAALADALIARIAQPVTHGGAVCRCAASIGIALGPPGAAPGRALFIDAELALYRAKAEGRGRAVFFTNDMRGAAQAKKRLSDEILTGIERDEFTCVYQPQFFAASGVVSGVEALVRWRAPGRDPQGPADFLTAADEMDAMARIDRIVLAKAVGDFRRWSEAGFAPPRLSVNLSMARLRSPDLARELAALDMPFERLSFELLESNFLDDHSDVVAANLQAIRALGIALEVDDFGSGHASILSVLRLKPARLKIDRALVAPVADSEVQAQLVRTIVDIGHLQGVDIIAEGVESEAQRLLLARIGCDELQGYALARPLTAEEIPGFLARHQPRPAPGPDRAAPNDQAAGAGTAEVLPRRITS